MMFTAEQWVAQFKAHPEAPLSEVRQIQADALRFAADHYAGAVSLNEAGLRISALANAIERGEDLGEFVGTMQTLGGPERADNPVRAYAQRRAD